MDNLQILTSDFQRVKDMKFVKGCETEKGWRRLRGDMTAKCKVVVDWILGKRTSVEELVKPQKSVV